MNKSGGVECLAWTWGIAILVGCFVAAMLWGLFSWTFMQGAFMGVLCLLILGALLTLMMCRGSSGPVQAGSTGARAAATAAPSTASAPAGITDEVAAHADAVEADATTAAENTDAAEAEAARAAQMEADRAANAEVERTEQARAEAARASEAAAAAEAKAAAAAQAEAEAQTRAEAASAAAEDVAAAPAASEEEGTRPAALDGPRGGTADDLKRIKGVGPKMEQLCNSLGFYHFDQIAAWTPDEVRWVDQNLQGFKGRVTRDDWVNQASLLASGGETEFSRKVDDGNVY
ncbi:hypothetical protein KUL25_20770 [Rhodobacteraceae bacterium N5(2021)]|uniref:Uncharacterized protein n=1 Tax=Gymnodinialimonas phycosphaerae TaxID=2841589 RepID=A0A975YFU9_9RHOB|nr:hypothetical protein [Gymnodinialimonas phycosphaerae]MBY4895203.1 hypothetical protein [Gymnodinialimonas phycosphaerae]